VKQLVFLVILHAILLQPISKVIVFGHFLVNQEEIATTLCEKRFEKDNSCGGCCQLRKNLEKTPQEKSPCKLKLAEVQLFMPLASSFSENKVVLPILEKAHFGVKSDHLSSFNPPIFHPPIV
jgi:hypothetical protein